MEFPIERHRGFPLSSTYEALILTILFLFFLAPFAFAQSPQPTESLTDEQWMPIY